MAPRAIGLRARGPRSLAALALVIAVLATGCSRGAPTAAPSRAPSQRAFPLTITDDDGVEVQLQSPPRRIVTFGQSHTEIVFALGLGASVVGVCCEFDNFPPEAADLPRVAGANQQPNLEKVLSLQPDIMLNAFPGSSTWAKRLRDSGVPVFTTIATDFDDAIDDIRTIGQVLGAEDAAARVTGDMLHRASEVQRTVATEPRVSCFLDLGQLYTVAPGDFPYDLLVRAGCDPVTSGVTTPYPQWSKEQIVDADPQVYLFTSDSGTTVESVEEDPAYRTVAAVREDRIYAIDGDVLSRPGPRLPEALEALGRALHPTVFSSTSG